LSEEFSLSREEVAFLVFRIDLKKVDLVEPLRVEIDDSNAASPVPGIIAPVSGWRIKKI
jgi:hypothetical protein